MTAEDAEIDEIAQKILLSLHEASFKDLTDPRYAKAMLLLSDDTYTKMTLKQIDKVSSGSGSEMGKKAVIKVLLHSTWLERLYFILRVFIMGRLSSIILFSVVLFLGVIDFAGMLVMDVFLFVFTLVVTRLFDRQIVQATKYVVDRLAGHRKTRDFIMNYF